MQSTAGLATLFADLARGLEGNRWCVMGAQAAILYGSTRMTLDVDISASIADAEHGFLLQRLGASGFSPRIEDALEFAQRTRVLLLVHSITGVPVDLVLAGPGIEDEFLDRARVLDIGGTRVPVLSPEDLIASKLLAGRINDLSDVESLLRRSELDLERIRELLRMFESALDRSDLLVEFERLARAANRT